jgi:hypothetical protein
VQWKEISDNVFILETVHNGYKIPFKLTPTKVCLRNNKSARDNPDFVSSEVD